MAVLDRAAGQFVCDFVERLPTTDTGKPFRPYGWQRDTLMEFYSTLEPDGESGELLRQYQYLYLEIPKKNGKSELAAALGLYHLFGDGELNAEVYLCAADKDNASIVFRAAVFMLESAPWTAKMIARGELKITKSQKKIEYRQQRRAENGGTRWVTVGLMAVLSAEAFSKHGYKPSCVIFDELHAQPNRDMWDVMTGAAGSAHQQPVWIVLTTAGDDPDRKAGRSTRRRWPSGTPGSSGASWPRGATPARCSPCGMWRKRSCPGPRRPCWSGTSPTGCRCCTA